MTERIYAPRALTTEEIIETEGRKIAEVLDKHCRYMMTGEGNAREIIREIWGLQRQGLMDRQQAKVLRSAMIPSDAEIRLRRIAAGADPELVYDNPWKNLAHLIAGTAWLAGFAGIIDIVHHAVESVGSPDNAFLTILLGVAWLCAWIWASSVAHHRTTGRVIERFFESR